MSKLEKLQDAAIDKLIEFLTAPKAVLENGKAKDVARISQSTLSAVARLRATERVADAMELAVIKHISEDRKAFEKHIKKALPHLHPDKKLLARPVNR